jgi:hypothetical protein
MFCKISSEDKNFVKNKKKVDVNCPCLPFPQFLITLLNFEFCFKIKIKWKFGVTQWPQKLAFVITS